MVLRRYTGASPVTSTNLTIFGCFWLKIPRFLGRAVHLDGFFAVLRILSITYGRHLQQFSQAIHHGGFVFQHGVGVAVQGYGRIFVPQYLRQRSDVHAAFEGASGKGVSQ